MAFSIDGLLTLLALPSVGLPALFCIAFISATFIPTGSEPALFAYVKLNPDMLWPAIFVATAGNVAGGMLDWWMGYGAKLALHQLRQRQERVKKIRKQPRNKRLLIWGKRYGAPMLLLSWLPIVGDPLCAVAGWLRLPWQRCLVYMTIGKFLRYAFVTALLMWIPDHFWSDLWKNFS